MIRQLREAYFHICVELNHAYQHFIFHIVSLVLVPTFDGNLVRSSWYYDKK